MLAKLDNLVDDMTHAAAEAFKRHNVTALSQDELFLLNDAITQFLQDRQEN